MFGDKARVRYTGRFVGNMETMSDTENHNHFLEVFDIFLDVLKESGLDFARN